MTDVAVESLLLRVYCLAVDSAQGRPLHERIVEAARKAGIAGATVLNGKMGFGRNGQIYSDLLSEIEIERAPAVVEIVDQPDRILPFISVLHDLVRGRRLMTLERAEVIHYGPELYLSEQYSPDTAQDHE